MFGLKKFFGGSRNDRDGLYDAGRAAGTSGVSGRASGASGASRNAGARGKKPQGAYAPKKSEFNLETLIDSSGSVDQAALDYVFSTGLPCMFDKLKSTSRDSDVVYNVELASFSSDFCEVLPFSNVSEIDWDPAEHRVESGGVTCMEDAMWEAFARIDRQKARQDAQRIPRSGSMIVVVTDGRPTDKEGYRCELSPELVEEIKTRNANRSTTTFVIGMGEVDDTTLLQLGPVTTETLEGGQTVEAAHAVRYVGGNYQDKHCWSAVCSLIGKASSSSSEDVFMVDESTAASLPNIDSVFVPDAGFAVVK